MLHLSNHTLNGNSANSVEEISRVNNTVICQRLYSVLQWGQITLFFLLLHMEYISPGTISIHSRPSIISEPGIKTVISPLWPHEGHLIFFIIKLCYNMRYVFSK